MTKPKRVLHWGMLGGYGGVEAFLMNLYRNIDREKLQFDFLTVHDQALFGEDEITRGGGGIYKEIYPKKESPIKHAQSLNSFFKAHAHEYNAVHMHMNFIRYYAPLVYAKKYGIPLRIYHSHNSADMCPSKSIIKKVLEADARKNVDKYATNLFACSDLAGKYMFGNKPFEIINNAIDTDKYIFNETVREKKRRELELGDSFVIGTVGRLQYQKNPEYIVEIFNELLKHKPNSVLIMVGTGNLEGKIREMIGAFDIEDKVKLLGQRFDVPELLQAFDCFLLPSRFEGLGMVYVEAQAAGLPCFGTQDKVPETVKLTDLMHFVPLTESPESWAKQMLSCIGTARTDRKSEVVQAGFDIKDLAKQMEKFYLGG